MNPLVAAVPMNSMSEIAPPHKAARTGRVHQTNSVDRNERMPHAEHPAVTHSYSAVFVDDDINVLRGLERLLRPLRTAWTMHFVTSGVAALDVLDATPTDVLVTDMRMPGMSGVELMEEVLQRHPGVVRIALSGRAERDTVIRAAHLAHQYLSKPCEPDLLKDRLVQAVRLRRLLQDVKLQAIVSKVSTLRSLPTLYVQLMAEMQVPDPSIARIAAIVAEDPGLTAKVLQVINSAYFGLRAHVADPEVAVRLLGFETIKALALSADLHAQLTRRRSAAAALLWHHCTRTGRTARRVAGLLGLPERQSAEAFTAGLLHDVGKLVLSEAVDTYDVVIAEGRQEGLDDSTVELRAFGATHAQVGAYLLGLWGLPYGIVEAIAWHHVPSSSGIPGPCALTAVHIADVLDHGADPSDVGGPALDDAYVSSLGLDGRVHCWKTSGVE